MAERKRVIVHAATSAPADTWAVYADLEANDGSVTTVPVVALGDETTVTTRTRDLGNSLSAEEVDRTQVRAVALVFDFAHSEGPTAELVAADRVDGFLGVGSGHDARGDAWRETAELFIRCRAAGNETLTNATAAVAERNEMARHYARRLLEERVVREAKDGDPKVVEALRVVLDLPSLLGESS